MLKLNSKIVPASLHNIGIYFAVRRQYKLIWTSPQVAFYQTSYYSIFYENILKFVLFNGWNVVQCLRYLTYLCKECLCELNERCLSCVEYLPPELFKRNMYTSKHFITYHNAVVLMTLSNVYRVWEMKHLETVNRIYAKLSIYIYYPIAFCCLKQNRKQF